MVSIKPLNPDEALRVRDFCLLIIKQVYGFNYRSDWHHDLDSLSADNGVYSAAKSGHFLVATNKTKIIGCIGLQNLDENPQLKARFEILNQQKSGSIWRTYIDHDYRNQGLGTKLYQSIEKHAKNQGYVYLYLHTSKDNPSAIKFWEKQGFKILSEENDQYQTVHYFKLI